MYESSCGSTSHYHLVRAVFLILTIYIDVQRYLGLPRWLSGKESTCQRRGCKRGWVQSLGREGPQKEKMAIYASILPCKIPWIGSLVRYSRWGQKKSQTRLSNWAHTRSGTSLLFEYSRPDGVWRGAPLHRALFCLHICPSEMSLRSLTHLFNQIFSHCWILRILCIFWRTILYQVCLPQIFPPSLWLLLIFYFVCWKV